MEGTLAGIRKGYHTLPLHSLVIPSVSPWCSHTSLPGASPRLTGPEGM